MPTIESVELTTAEHIWDEIRRTLALCGDIGKFSADDFEFEDMPRVVWNGKPVLPLSIIGRSIELGLEINEVYWNVFEALAIAASGKLSFDEKLSIAFADALTCIRTGIVAGHRTQAEQCIAQDIYLEQVEYGTEWDPDSDAIQTQVRAVYDKFQAWRSNPAQYKKEVDEFWDAR